MDAHGGEQVLLMIQQGGAAQWIRRVMDLPAEDAALTIAVAPCP